MCLSIDTRFYYVVINEFLPTAAKEDKSVCDAGRGALRINDTWSKQERGKGKLDSSEEKRRNKKHK